MGNACVNVVPIYPEKTTGQKQQYDSTSKEKQLDLTAIPDETDDTTVVRASWAEVSKFNLEDSGILLMLRIITQNPHLAPLWKFTEGRETEEQLRATPELKSHGVRVLWMVGAAVDSLGALDYLVPVLEGLGERHYTYGVRAEYFEPVVEAVHFLLKDRLGPRYSPRVKTSWDNILKVVAATMTTGMNKEASKAH